MPTVTPPWAPTVDDVGGLLRSRTKLPGGREAGTFTDDTRPTRTEVYAMIEEHVVSIVAPLGDDIVLPGWWEHRLRRLVTYLVAIDIELGYFPEQVGTGQSPLPGFERQVERMSVQWDAWLGSQGVETGGVVGGSVTEAPPPAPVWSFPVVCPPVRWW